mmetsp:Transcript_27899/g.75878  ORF Transcript_27899/g.75878 Transcript_27899/m.75878 type:complete len:234 (+) Transcript_27899:244-945(+)
MAALHCQPPAGTELRLFPETPAVHTGCHSRASGRGRNGGRRVARRTDTGVRILGTDRFPAGQRLRVLYQQPQGHDGEIQHPVGPLPGRQPRHRGIPETRSPAHDSPPGHAQSRRPRRRFCGTHGPGATGGRGLCRRSQRGNRCGNLCDPEFAPRPPKGAASGTGTHGELQRAALFGAGLDGVLRICASRALPELAQAGRSPAEDSEGRPVCEPAREEQRQRQRQSATTTQQQQ